MSRNVGHYSPPCSHTPFKGFVKRYYGRDPEAKMLLKYMTHRSSSYPTGLRHKLFRLYNQNKIQHWRFTGLLDKLAEITEGYKNIDRFVESQYNNPGKISLGNGSFASIVHKDPATYDEFS